MSGRSSPSSPSSLFPPALSSKAFLFGLKSNQHNVSNGAFRNTGSDSYLDDFLFLAVCAPELVDATPLTRGCPRRLFPPPYPLEALLGAERLFAPPHTSSGTWPSARSAEEMGTESPKRRPSL
jgi:hypothetical protein